MNFFELEPADISSLSDGDLRELVARLCEAELVQQGMQPSCVTWGGAQEAADGGLDVNVKNASGVPPLNFVPRENTGFQVKKHSIGRAACKNEMEDGAQPKAVIADLAVQKGAYIIVSGRDDCSEKMLSERLKGMKEAVDTLPNKDDLHLDFYGRDRLSAWLRRHPSVALWARSRLGKPLAGWRPYGRWAATPLDQDDELLLDEHPCILDANSSSKEPMSVLEGIELCLDRLNKPGSTVRITGLSGVGKTRFAQALFEKRDGLDTLPASDVIYADLGEVLVPTASELVTYLIANDFATFLVLDNCPPDAHRTLQKQVCASGAKLRLLTIEYDISDDKPEETEVIHLEPTSEQTVAKLVQRRFPDLGRTNSERISEFAGGNARIALALAGRVNADETLSSFSDEELFRRLFSQRKGESAELLRSAEALALVYSFDASRSAERDELGVVGAIAGLPRKTLHRDQAELLRRQLAQQRGKWRAVLPHALATRLAKRALENTALEDINAELFKPENLRLFQSCAHRLGYLHDFEPARELALSWVRPDAPLGDISQCGEQYLIVLDRVAPVFPEVVLSAIERASAQPNFASRQNENHSRLVHLLCQLAYDDETFDRVAALLLRFSETENRDEKSDSIVGQLRQLFSLHLSGTEATPERRQEFVRKLLSSSYPRHAEIARELLSAAFEAHHWTSFGTFHFGARKRGPGWSPKTQDDQIAWFDGYIKLLFPALGSDQPADMASAKTLLASHFRGLWSFAGCFDSLEAIIRSHGRDGVWPEMWISIKQAIHFDGDQLHPEVLTRLESLEKLTAPTDAYSEIEAYALVDAWDHMDVRSDNYQERAEEIYRRVINLGQVAANQPEYLDRLGAKLWETRVQSISWFGQGLALGSANKLSLLNILIESFTKHRSELANTLLLEGYFNGAQQSDAQQTRQLLERALEIPELKRFSITLLSAVPIVPWISRTVLKLAHEAELEATRFEQISYGRVHEAMSDGELTALLDAINKLPKGYLSSLRILSMRLFGKEPHEHALGEELCAVTREAIRQLASAHRDELRQSQLHGIDRVLKEACGPSAPAGEVKEIIDLLCQGIRTHRLYAFELPKVISALLTMHPELFLDAVFDGGEREQALVHMLFRDRIGRREPSLNDAPLDRVLAWCGQDQNRISKLAHAVSAFAAKDVQDPLDDHPKRLVLSNHIQGLLRVASDKLALAQIILGHVKPTSWSGSRASIFEVRTTAFSELLNHPHSDVRQFARNTLPILEQELRLEYEYEAADHNEREQRFE